MHTHKPVITCDILISVYKTQAGRIQISFLITEHQDEIDSRPDLPRPPHCPRICSLFTKSQSSLIKVNYLDKLLKNIHIYEHHPHFRVERSAEAGKQNPSENKGTRVRRKKGGNNHSQRRQQRRRQRRKNWRKGNGKQGRKQQQRKKCGCARKDRQDAPSDDCLSTALKYQIAVSAFLANLKRQENRSEF